jgi:hypothetical protein
VEALEMKGRRSNDANVTSSIAIRFCVILDIITAMALPESKHQALLLVKVSVLRLVWALGLPQAVLLQKVLGMA